MKRIFVFQKKGTPVTRQEIIEKINNIVAVRTNFDVSKLQLESRFKEDLAADSLVKLDIIMEVEETFQLTIQDEDTETIKTIGDAVNYIEKRLNGK